MQESTQGRLPVVIGISGPPGIGKSWLGQKIMGLLDGRDRRGISIREFIWMEVQPLYQWRDSYEAFKKTVHKHHLTGEGITGREAMIDHAEYRRGQDLHYWDRMMVESPLYCQTDIVIHDSLRMFEEQEWFEQHSREMHTIVMAPTRYSIGCIYDGDSGRCLPPRGGFRTIDSTKALEIVKPLLAQWTPQHECNHSLGNAAVTAADNKTASHVGRILE